MGLKWSAGSNPIRCFLTGSDHTFIMLYNSAIMMLLSALTQKNLVSLFIRLLHSSRRRSRSQGSAKFLGFQTVYSCKQVLLFYFISRGMCRTNWIFFIPSTGYMEYFTVFICKTKLMKLSTASSGTTVVNFVDLYRLRCDVTRCF